MGENIPSLSLPPEGTVAFEDGSINESDVSENLTCDLLVIGAGPAGLSAAASAAENGLRVILLEKSSAISAHATQLGNYNSRFLVQAGHSTDPNEVLNSARIATQYRCNEDVWRRELPYDKSSLDCFSRSFIGCRYHLFGIRPLGILLFRIPSK